MRFEPVPSFLGPIMCLMDFNPSSGHSWGPCDQSSNDGFDAWLVGK